MRRACTRFRIPAWALVAFAAVGLACSAPEPSERRPRPLRIGLHGDPSSLDPHLQQEVIAQTVVANIYDTLVTFDVKMKIEPALAESWQNPDELTWRFRLRPGVHFHDGSDLTAADVAFSLDRARSHPDSRVSANLLAVERVAVVNDLTIELHTATPYPILLNKLAFIHIVPEGAPAKIERPVGTGPYRLVSFEPGKRVVLEAFPGHWRGPAAEPRVEFLFVADAEERLKRLVAGDLDLIDEVAPENTARLAEVPGVRTESRSGLSVSYLQMNVAVPPFDDPRVREALDLAIDRQALVDEVLAGHGQPVGQMVSPTVFGYNPDLAVTERDMERARALLEESGYRHLALILEFRTGRETLVEPLRRQLLEAGIVVEPIARPWSEMYPRLVSGEVAFYLGTWVCTSGDASDFFDDKVHTANPDRGYGSANPNGYSNPELDTLIENSAITAMPDRVRILQKALARIAEERPFLPLYMPFDLYGVRDELSWVPRQDGRIYAYEMHR